jgi:hypothetical protein
MPANPYPARRVDRNDIDPQLPTTVLQCLVVKQQIIRQVIEGRMVLWEAASRFQTVHRVAAACIESATGIPASTSDGENLCRTVIGWVYLSLSNRPEEAERVSNRLERELQSHLEKNGKANHFATI